MKTYLIIHLKSLFASWPLAFGRNNAPNFERFRWKNSYIPSRYLGLPIFALYCLIVYAVAYRPESHIGSFEVNANNKDTFCCKSYFCNVCLVQKCDCINSEEEFSPYCRCNLETTISSSSRAFEVQKKENVR